MDDAIERLVGRGSRQAHAPDMSRFKAPSVTQPNKNLSAYLKQRYREQADASEHALTMTQDSEDRELIHGLVKTHRASFEQDALSQKLAQKSEQFFQDSH